MNSRICSAMCRRVQGVKQAGHISDAAHNPHQGEATAEQPQGIADRGQAHRYSADEQSCAEQGTVVLPAGGKANTVNVRRGRGQRHDDNSDHAGRKVQIGTQFWEEGSDGADSEKRHQVGHSGRMEEGVMCLG